MASSEGKKPSAEAVSYMIHHVVLPLKLPQAYDRNTKHEVWLFELAIFALERLHQLAKTEHADSITSAIATIKNFRDCRDHHGDVVGAQLEALLAKLTVGTTDGALPLEIKAQNAAILITRNTDSLNFDFFELLPSNNATMNSGRLVRTFPGCSATIPVAKMTSELCKSLAGTISKMTTQTAPGFQPQVNKNGKRLDENRDTTHPGLVTDFLMHVVIAIGKPVPVQDIRKHTREETLWDSCLLPWQRTPLWLLLRVVIQLHFSRASNDGESSDDLYKAFIMLFLSRLLDLANIHRKDSGSEMLHAIIAKLIRRLRKFELCGHNECLQSDWVTGIRSGILDAHRKMDAHWRGLLNDKKADIDTTMLSRLRPTNDLDMNLPELDSFLAKIALREVESTTTIFEPDSPHPDLPPTELPDCITSSGVNDYFSLMAVEEWVEKNLCSWTTLNLRDESVCGRLRRLIEKYYSTASVRYAGMPYPMSLMYLTIFEMWVACDRSACAIFPMLLKYDPEICVAELTSLILPLKSQMQRLHIVEQYVVSRRDVNSTGKRPSVYSDFGHPDSFAVKYFQQSDILQATLSQIEQDAMVKRQAKCNELSQLRGRYQSLMHQYNNTPCEFDTVVTNRFFNYQEERHSSNCSRCEAKDTASQLQIGIYEWPVSSNPIIAQATVFEVKIPQAFSDWRDISRCMITTIFSHQANFTRPLDYHATLETHQDISELLSSRYSERRMVLASSIKAHIVTHRKHQKAVIHLTQEDVCLENALRYEYFDASQRAWSTTSLLCTEKVPKNCMYVMPHRSKKLERFTYKSPTCPDGTPPNEIMASLSDCPAHFSIKEYKAFASIPFGRNALYSNILAQLANSAVNFAKVETQCLILQVVQQAGQSNENIERANHRILLDDDLGNIMLDRLEESRQGLAENWESWRAFMTFSLLARRILSLTSSQMLKVRCVEYLVRLRSVCMGWIIRLKQRAALSTDVSQRSEMCSRATEIALLSTSTYEVEDDDMDMVLHSQSAVSMLLQCSITIQENHSSAKSEFQDVYESMLQSWRLLMYRVFPFLRGKILQSNEGICDAVSANWVDFRPKTNDFWRPLERPHKHWLHIDSGGLPVHFNLLTAELLVNGLPLARLPQEFIEHPMYATLFRQCILEVAPANEPGLKLSAKMLYNSYKLHFGMNRQQLSLVATIGQSRYDLLPSDLFQHKLPQAFVTNHVHWYDHFKDEVIFRSRKTPWITSSEDWRLEREHTTKSWRLVRDSSILINMRSQSACKYSSILQPLEDAEHIHTVLNSETQIVDISLPRLQLAFFTKQDLAHIYSRQYRGMIIDESQTIEVLIGLASKLTLRAEHSNQKRMVLVPVPHGFGKRSIQYQKSDTQHVSVHINKGDATTTYAYSLDPDLKRVLGSGDIHSQLFLCYLFALTSHCLPDPMTMRTGTESALMILRSAAVRSFDILTEKTVSLLAQIGSLSPARSFYPSHLREMQTVTWDNGLPPLSQHPGFREGVERILEHAMRMRPFYPEACIFDSIRKAQEELRSEYHLITREAIRASTFRTHGFGAEQFTTTQDVEYQARHRQKASERGLRAFRTATMMLKDPFALHESIPDLRNSLEHTHFSTTTVQGLRSSFDVNQLAYDSEWLQAFSDHLAEMWCNLHQNLTRLPGNYNKYAITTWLASMAYAETADMTAIEAVICFYRSKSFKNIQVPTAQSFDLSRGHEWDHTEISDLITKAFKPFETSAEARLPRNRDETQKQHLARIRTLFQTHRSAETKSILAELEKMWPVREPRIPSTARVYLDLSPVRAAIKEKFIAWWDNREFLQYLDNMSRMTALQRTKNIAVPVLRSVQPFERPALSQHLRHFRSDDLFSGSSELSLDSRKPPREPKILAARRSSSSQSRHMEEQLETFCRRLQTLACSKQEKNFVADLRSSCAALKKHVGKVMLGDNFLPNTLDLLTQYRDSCKSYFDYISDSLARSIADKASHADRVGLQTHHSPRLSPSFWLECLHRDRFEALHESWKAVIVKYGLAITQLHRAQRLLALSDKKIDLAEELSHIGHSNWDPSKQSETLLLEAESGILVRKEQALIAEHMISPLRGDNTVLQLQMGQGKSTVLVPWTAAALTDAVKLVRVVVAKPQSKQMLQMLVSKLGGLLNRQIYHMPFSRALRWNADEAETIRKLYEECKEKRGILLIQPEHILSFKLVGIDMILTERNTTADLLLSTQQFFDENSRDIVDESDENFSVKFELIYTMGTQENIEFSPGRWQFIQEILGIMLTIVDQIQSQNPSSIDIQGRADGRVPRIRLLDKDATDQLLGLIAEHIAKRGMKGLPCYSQPEEMQKGVLRYISEPELEEQDIEQVEGGKFWTDLTKSPLLLARGLIAGGILRFVFTTKRWRVNFGLDETRILHTSLAVPYRFKDSPSPRAEFSHPDVVILLTMLSYYYQGLSDEQLFDSFIHLAKSDQSANHYHEWVSTAASSLPTAFRRLSGVSIRDRHQCVNEVFPFLRYSKKAIDYYLSCLVFPKQLKQFPEKLSASGWDIGAIKTHPLTGFSGTNDTLHLLPLEVKHLDLPSQKYTNAQVLSYLLKDETSVALLPSRMGGNEHSDAQHLISMIENLESDIRVLIDCGASILEQNNKQVAETWLNMRGEDIQAVVFFDEDELSVLDRSGHTEFFQSSSFAKQLDVCIIYLDQPHARGTDLRLPRDYKAAVTLGNQLTKDHLAQACMRMRKLGHGQTVTFIVPEEISMKISQFTKKCPETEIDVSDVLCWSIGETWQDLKRSMPLWAVQGERFERQKHLLNGADTTVDQAEQFLEQEAQSLEKRYRPRLSEDNAEATTRGWDMSNDNIAQIVTRCRDFDALCFGSAALSEEQERELAPEIEEERQIERPPNMEAKQHYVHRDLEQLISDGTVVKNYTAFRPAFQALRSTSAAEYSNLNHSPSFPSGLLVSVDFMRTVKILRGSPGAFDSYQRPFQFVLSVPGKTKPGSVTHLIIISPFEANVILPKLRKTKKVTLHLFSPRTNAGFPSLDELMLYNVGHAFEPGSVSRNLTVQLNLFAGTLYLRSFEEYSELCDLLGLLKAPAEKDQLALADGFIESSVGGWGLSKSPTPFLRVLYMRIRHEGEGVEKTHLGRILSGEILSEADFRDENTAE